VNEFDLIQRYFSQLTDNRVDTVAGIGDDCALLRPDVNRLLAVSTDTLVSGRHFPADTDPKSLGFKCLAVNLSDLAAMGAEPAWVSLSLTLPEQDEAWLTSFAAGFGELARHYQLQLVGGDLTRGPLSITVTIHGQVQADRVMRRNGASVGDLVCVSGNLGDAALALHEMRHGEVADIMLQQALDRPQPMVGLGIELATYASSCIDISDGLVADLGHICDASQCQAQIQLELLPCSEPVLQHIAQSGSWAVAVSGGDDYQLCFTIPPQHRDKLAKISESSGIAIAVIGEIKAGQGVFCFDRDHQLVKLKASGYKHF